MVTGHLLAWLGDRKWLSSVLMGCVCVRVHRVASWSSPVRGKLGSVVGSSGQNLRERETRGSVHPASVSTVPPEEGKPQNAVPLLVPRTPEGQRVHPEPRKALPRSFKLGAQTSYLLHRPPLVEGSAAQNAVWRLTAPAAEVSQFCSQPTGMAEATHALKVLCHI